MDEKKLQKLDRLLELVDQDFTTPEDVSAAISAVTDAFKQVDSRIEAKIEEVKKSLDASNVASNEGISRLREALASLGEDIRREIAEISLTPGDKGDKGEKGDKGDSIKGDKGDNGSPDTAEDIRNKLELLQGEERLDRSAIRGLEEFFKENTKKGDDGITRIIGANRPLFELSDVEIAGIQIGQSIIWTGTAWVPYTPGGGGSANIFTEAVTATDAGGNNVNIDLTQLTYSWTLIQNVFRNGNLTDKNKWSILGDTLTLTGAVATNSFQITYNYT